MNEPKKNSVHILDITGYTAEGLGVARLDGRVVFVPNTIRGERWQVQLLKVNKNVAWGRGVKPVLESACRVPSDCPYSGPCGGCQFRHMDYKEELEAKRQRVEDALRRVGGVDITVDTVHGARDTHRYRNKVQFPVGRGKNGVHVGLFRARSHDVLDVADCLLQSEDTNRLGRALKGWMERGHIPAYDEKTGKGLVRHLYVRTNRAGESLVCLVANGKKLPDEMGLVSALRSSVSGLVGVVLNRNEKDTNVILGDSYRTLWGRDWLEEELCGLRFRLSVPSFFQINREQTEVLYGRAVDFAGLAGNETVLDLYCGIGTISLAMAQKAGRVIGAEIVPEAIEDAKENALRNGVGNAEFFCGDAGEVAYKLAADGVRPDVICVDPPRKGLAPDVPDILADMAPERIVYVSCDPATLARDVKRLGERGYTVKCAEAVDLFPRTQHVETVVLLSRGIYPQSIEVTVDVDEGEVTEQPTYKRIQKYVEENYGFKVHTAYIAEVKRMCGLEMHKAPNAVEQRKHEYHACPPEKVAAIKDALKHFGMI